MRIAVVADIHGNVRALEAVVADIVARAPDLVVDLGDCLSGPLEAGATADRLIDLGWPTLRGNHDRYLCEIAPEAMGRSDAAAFAQTTAAHRAWLAALPPTLEPAPGVFACHGTPSDDDRYLVERASDQGVTLRPPAEILADLRGIDAEIVLHGHSHMPRLLRLATGQLLLNPGSVGLQAYEDDHPVVHRMQAGSPHARYALLDRGPIGWSVTFRLVPYDWDAAAATALAAGRPEWAHALATGFMPG